MPRLPYLTDKYLHDLLLDVMEETTQRAQRKGSRHCWPVQRDKAIDTWMAEQDEDIVH